MKELPDHGLPDARVMIEPLSIEEEADFLDCLMEDIEAGILTIPEADQLIDREYALLQAGMHA